jgi:hypothetical protein
VRSACTWRQALLEGAAGVQAALDSGARKVIIPPMCDDSYANCPTSQSTGDHKWVTLPLEVRSNTVLVLQVGVQLWAKRWEYTTSGASVLNLEFVSNVDIIGYGAIVHMWKQDYAYRPGAPKSGPGTCQPGVGIPCNYSKAEWRHCINVRESENVTISGLTASSSGGDGIEIGAYEMTYPSPACTAAHKYPSCHTPAILKQGGCCRVSVSRNVHIKDFTATNNYRQGMSVTGAVNLLVEDSLFELTGGTAPMCGVDLEPDTNANLMQNITFRRCTTRNNYECGFSFALYACTVPSQPTSVTLEDCHSIGDRMGSYNVESIYANVSGTIHLKDCTSTGGSGPGLMLRGKDAEGASLQVTNMRLVNTATKMWIAGGEELRFPVSIARNGPTIGAQGGVHFTNLTVIDHLESLPGGSLKPGPLEATSKRSWLNATVPKGLEGISGDVTVVNSHGCSEIVEVGVGARKNVSLKVTCKQL